MFRRTVVSRFGRRALPGLRILAAYAVVACTTAPADGAHIQDDTTRSARAKPQFDSNVRMRMVAFGNEKAVPEKCCRNQKRTLRAASSLDTRRSHLGTHPQLHPTGSCEAAASSCTQSRCSAETPQGAVATREMLSDKKGILHCQGDDEAVAEATRTSQDPQYRLHGPDSTATGGLTSVVAKHGLPAETASARSERPTVHLYSSSMPKHSLDAKGQEKEDEMTDVRRRQQAASGYVGAQAGGRKQNRARRTARERRVREAGPSTAGQATGFTAQEDEDPQICHHADTGHVPKNEGKEARGVDTSEEALEYWPRSIKGSALTAVDHEQLQQFHAHAIDPALQAKSRTCGKQRDLAAVGRGGSAQVRFNITPPSSISNRSTVIGTDPFKQASPSCSSPKTKRVPRLCEALGTLTLEEKKKPTKLLSASSVASLRQLRKKKSRSPTREEGQAPNPACVPSASTASFPSVPIVTTTHTPLCDPSSLPAADDETRGATKSRVFGRCRNSRKSCTSAELPRNKAAVRSATATPRTSRVIDIPGDQSICPGLGEHPKSTSTLVSHAVSLDREYSPLNSESAGVGGSGMHLIGAVAASDSGCYGGVGLPEATNIERIQTPGASVRDASRLGRPGTRSAIVSKQDPPQLWATAPENAPITTLRKVKEQLVPRRMPTAKNTCYKLLRGSVKAQPRTNDGSFSGNDSDGETGVFDSSSWNQVQRILKGEYEGFTGERVHLRRRRNKRYISQGLENFKQSPGTSTSDTLPSEVLRGEEHSGSVKFAVAVPTSTSALDDEDYSSGHSNGLGADEDTQDVRRKTKSLPQHPASSTADHLGRSTLVEREISDRLLPTAKIGQGLTVSQGFSTASRTGKAGAQKKNGSVPRQSGGSVRKPEVAVVQLVEDPSNGPALYAGENRRESFEVVGKDRVQEVRKASETGKIAAKEGIACGSNKETDGISASFLEPALGHSNTIDSAPAAGSPCSVSPASAAIEGIPTAIYESGHAGPWTGEHLRRSGRSGDDGRLLDVVKTVADLHVAPEDNELQENEDILIEQENLQKLFGGRLAFTDVEPAEEVPCLTTRGIRGMLSRVWRRFRRPRLPIWTCAGGRSARSASIDDNDSAGTVSTHSIFSLAREDLERMYGRKKKS